MYTIQKTGYILGHRQNPFCDNPLHKDLSEFSQVGKVGLLERLLNQIFAGYSQSLVIKRKLPAELTEMFQDEMSYFAAAGSKRLALTAQSIRASSQSQKAKLNHISNALSLEFNKLGTIIQRHDVKFQTYLSLCERNDYQHFLFLSEQGETTCDRCHAHHGELLTAEEISELHLLPPLHPNCKCHVVALDIAAEGLYTENSEMIINSIQAALEEIDSVGGTFLLAHEFSWQGICTDTLQTIESTQGNIISERKLSPDTWDEKLYKRATGQYTMAFISQLFESGENFLNHQKKQSEDDPLIWFLYAVNEFTMGQAGDLWQGMEDRHARFWNSPSLYTWMDNALFGAMDQIGIWVFPREEDDFEALVNRAGLAVVTYLLSDAFGGTIGDFFDTTLSVVDDIVDSVANGLGLVVDGMIRSANIVADSLITVGEQLVAAGTRVGDLLYEHVVLEFLDVGIDILDLVSDSADNLLEWLEGSGESFLENAAIATLTSLEQQVIADANLIFNCAEFSEITAAYENGAYAKIVAAGYEISFEPDLPPYVQGMTYFEGPGFHLGPAAFDSGEIKQTILHEVYRLITSQSKSGVNAELTATETDAARTFADTFWMYID